MKAEFKRRQRPYSSRQFEVKQERRRILIVCEGKQTEPNYFRAFRIPGVEIRVEGLGDHTTSLVARTIELSTDGDYEQVWCVLDRDSFPLDRFNAALELAENNKVQVAYSNEAFELWYVLHFDFLHAGVSRADYITILSQRLGVPYFKNNRDMYDLIVARQATAVKNAERLHRRYAPCRPGHDNPSTTVYLLVKELLKQ